MAELKTKPNNLNVETYLNGIADELRRYDCHILLKIMKQVTKAEPKMWGDSIIGFGSYPYKYKSRREGDWFLTGFSSRKQSLTLYIMSGFKNYNELLDKLGKYKTGKSCLYIKRLENINWEILKDLIEQSVKSLSKTGN